MALNTSKCNHLMPLGFKGKTDVLPVKAYNALVGMFCNSEQFEFEIDALQLIWTDSLYSRLFDGEG